MNKVLHVANKQKKTFVSRLAGFCVLGGEHGTTWCLNRETVLKIVGPFRRFAEGFRVLGTPHVSLLSKLFASDESFQHHRQLSGSSI